jgi:hypothetical protein
MWPCISARPGIRKRPFPRTITASSGILIEEEGPSAVIRSPSTMRVWSPSTSSSVTGMTETPTKAVFFVVPCPSPENESVRPNASVIAVLLITISFYGFPCD